jgi:aryl-alcohol dehydrogenase-like predicted oxidoreductase
MDVLKELAQIKSEGVLIGFSVSGPQQAQVIQRALEIKIDDRRLFDSLQVTWNILERSATQVLKEAHEMGVGIIVKEALANGRLTGKNTAPNDAAKLAVLKEEALRLNTTVDGLVLAAVLSQPWVDVVLSGAARVEHLESNLKAVDVVYDGEAESRLSGLVEDPRVYWETRSSLVWN